MSLQIEEKNLNKFIVVGDRVLIKPKNQKDRTKSGLYLPPGVQEKEKIHSGYVLKVGPGYPIPAIAFQQADCLNFLRNDQAFHVCYHIEENEWNGKVNLQINVKDIKFP